MESLNTPPTSNSRIFLPLLISMLGIFATSLAIIVYHFVLARYCVRRQQATTSTMENAPRPRPTGVDEKVLETIPVMPYSSLKNRNAHHSECAVCLGEMEDDERVRLLPNCKHAFHLSCIDQWFMAHVNCPLCRSAVVAEEAGDGERTRIIFQLPAMGNTRNNNNNNNDNNNNNNNNNNVISDHHLHHESENSTSHNAISSVGQGQPSALLCHCYSLVLERKSSPSFSSRGLVVGLKRSLSMDHSYVVVHISDSESERQRDSSSSSCSSVLSLSSLRAKLSRSQSDRGCPPSLRHLDRISIKLLGSLSRLHAGNTDGILLPY